MNLPDDPLGPPLAYENTDFLNSPDGRALRILSEYQEPLARFRRERIQDTVVFFGSARFRALDVATNELEFLENTGSAAAAPPGEQPSRHLTRAAGPHSFTPTAADAPAIADDSSARKRRLAEAAVHMAQHYEDARTLARKLSTWTRSLPGRRHRFVVTSGGGPGVMEAANRGASEAGAKTIGLNIVLPFEQQPNPWITPALSFNFHYFFMRKFWFAYLAKALVVFPGGFGTLDEMFELLTLAQTQKLAKPITVIIYGSSYWKSIIDFNALIDRGAIAARDMDLLQFADTPDQAFYLLQAGLTHHLSPGTPTNQAPDQPPDPDITPTR